LDLALKEVVDRPRPAGDGIQVIVPATGLSFPSGHALSSCLVYGFLALMAWTHIRRCGVRRLVTAILALLPVGIGLSRVYLGVHWFSDVIGGWAAGLFCLLLLAEADRRGEE
jgi:undecaprenyl-diphosphatase